MTGTLTAAPMEFVVTDSRGIAYLAGTRMKVGQIARDVQQGLTPQEIHAEYPHLSFAQIHAALAYYYAHQTAVEAHNQDEEQEAAELLAQYGKPVDTALLRARAAQAKKP